MNVFIKFLYFFKRKILLVSLQCKEVVDVIVVYQIVVDGFVLIKKLFRLES